MNLTHIIGRLVFFLEGCICILCLTGCVTPRKPVEHRDSVTSTQRSTHIPKHHHIAWYNKINPVWWLQNIDDKEPPPEYLPNNKCRKFWYSIRNPFHNFTFYVIGIADRRFEISGTYTEHVFNPHDGFNFTVSRCGPFLLPFVSYKKDHVKLYIGWRPDGNFGLKFNPKGD